MFTFKASPLKAGAAFEYADSFQPGYTWINSSPALTRKLWNYLLLVDC
jgi:hypothetical protein